MAMKGYSAFPKAPTSLEPHHQIILCHKQDTRWRRRIPLQKAVAEFYCPNLQGKKFGMVYQCIYSLDAMTDTDSASENKVMYHGKEKTHSEIELFINSSGTVRLVL